MMASDYAECVQTGQSGRRFVRFDYPPPCGQCHVSVVGEAIEAYDDNKPLGVFFHRGCWPLALERARHAVLSGV